MNVKELKDLIKDWPETNHLGEPTEVWMMTGVGVSSPVIQVSRLNNRLNDDGRWVCDMLMEPNHDALK